MSTYSANQIATCLTFVILVLFIFVYFFVFFISYYFFVSPEFKNV